MARIGMFLPVVLSLAALTGLFFDSIGRILIWSLFAVALFRVKSLELDRRLLRNTALFLMCLAAGSLLSVNPASSLAALVKVIAGFCVFLPGVYVGRLLDDPKRLRWAFAPMFFLGVAHFASPVLFNGRLIYGFDANPNIIGRGLAYAVLLMLVCVFTMAARDGAASRASSFGVLGWMGCVLAVGIMGYLLLLANYRSGWLALFCFVSCMLLMSPGIPHVLRVGFWSLAVIVLAGLVLSLDSKGFGYGSVGERLDLWRRGLAAWWTKFPLFGAGMKSFDVMHHVYLYPPVTRVYRYPHNVLVELIFSLGIFGVLAVSAYAVSMVRVFRDRGFVLSASTVPALSGLIAVLVWGQLEMELASFYFVGALASFAGILYARLDPSRILSATEANPLKV